jgi:divalent metal cation (Fe/Co/Zn/Cd) transporter
MTETSKAYPPTADLRATRERNWVRIGLWLVSATMAYNTVEGVLALWAGVRADSIALVGFGLDSFIECAAAAVLLWRLGVEARGAAPEAVETSERRVHRFVGGTFLALALYVLAQGSFTLWWREAPEETVFGIVLAAVSLVVMPLVSWGKLRAANHIGSAALRSEAKETLACSYLSLTLLVGLAANAVAGWWWADPMAALLMTPWLVKEGMEGLRGESCCEHGA